MGEKIIGSAAEEKARSGNRKHTIFSFRPKDDYYLKISAYITFHNNSTVLV